MQTAHLPQGGGIYQIRNKTNGKCYVGSSGRVRGRLQHHHKSLREGTHYNPKLQHAWNKYGEESFEAVLLEPVLEKRRLCTREQSWIDQLDSIANGYNIVTVAVSSVGRVWKPDTIERRARSRAKPIPGWRMPDGSLCSILYLAGACREFGLSEEAMRMVMKGRNSSHRGWTHENAKKSARMVVGEFSGFIDPQGKEIPTVYDLQGFCRERGLKRKDMLCLYRGSRLSVSGWTYKGNRAPKPHAGNQSTAVTCVGFFDPEGRPVTIHNLHRFCIDHGLDERSMCRLKSGELISCKGWTFGSPEGRPRKRPHKENAWANGPNGERVHVTNYTEFCEQHGLDPQRAAKARHLGHCYYGWTFKSATDAA